MATYKYNEYLKKTTTEEEFDHEHGPGSASPLSGIYHCMGCGREVAATEHQPLPPQNHHQHSPAQGHIRWKLVASAEHSHKGK